MAPRNGNTKKTIEFVGDASSVSKAAQKMVADFERAADQIQKLNLGKGLQDLPEDAKEAARKTVAKLQEINDLKLAKKTLEIDVELEKARKDLDDFATKSEKSAGRFKGAFSDGLSNLTGNLTSQLGPAGDAIESFAGGLGGMSTVAVAGGAAIAGLALAAKSGISAFNDQAATVLKFQTVTKSTTTAASDFVNALDDVGISADAGASALGKLAQNADSKAFKQLGIEVERTNTGAVDLTATFTNVLEKLDGISDPVARANILTTAFGKSWQDLAPLIDQGAASFENALKANKDLRLSEEDLQSYRDYRAATDEFGDSIEAVKLKIGKGLVPIAAEEIKNLNEAIAAVDGFTQALPGDVDLKGIRELLGWVNPSGPLVKGFQGVAAQARKLGEELGFIDEKATGVGKVVDTVNEKLLKQGPLYDAVTAAAQRKANADAVAEQTADARATAEKKAAEDAVRSQEAAAAAYQKRVAASLGLASAQDNAERALSKLNVAEEINAEKRKQAAQIAADVSKAEDAVTRAREALGAQTKRNSEDIERSEKAIETARERVKSASERVTDAERNLNKAKEDAATASDKAKRADEAYQRVIKGVGTEADEAKAKLVDLNDAKAGASSAELGVRSADRRLTQARANLASVGDSNRLDLERQRIQLDLEEASGLVSAAEKRKADLLARGTTTAEDVAAADRDIARARVDQAQRTAELSAQLANLTDQSDELGQATDEVRQAELDAERARRDYTEATKDADEAASDYEKTVSGYPETSDKAKDADLKRKDAIKDAADAEDKVVKATGDVQKAKTDRKKASDDVTGAEKDLKKAIDDARVAEEKRREELKNAQTELGKTRTKTIELKDETVKYHDRVRDAITAEADFIKKSYEARGKVITDAEAIRLAFGKVEAQIRALGDPALAAALAGVADPLLAALGSAGSGGSAGYSPSSSSDGPIDAGRQSAKQSAASGGTAKGPIDAGRGAAIGDRIATAARQKLGIKESDGTASAFLGGLDVKGEANAWCQRFVNQVFKNLGLDLPNANSASTRQSFEAFQKLGAVDQNPNVGDLAYKTRGEGKGHVGIVLSVDLKKGTVTTIDGNSNDQVQTVTRNIDDFDLGFVDPSKLALGGGQKKPQDAGRQSAQKAPAQSNQKLTNIAEIVAVAKAAGLSTQQIYGLLGNAQIESQFSDTAVGDNGDSYGVFQANRRLGIGKGKSVNDLQDTTYNTRLILSDPGLKKALQSTTAEDFARAFDKYVERSDGKAREKRAAAAKSLQGDAAVRAIVEGKGTEKTQEAVKESGRKTVDTLGRSSDRQVDATNDGLGRVDGSLGTVDKSVKGLGGRLDSIPGYVEAIGSSLGSAFGSLDGTLDGVATAFSYAVEGFATAVGVFASVDLAGQFSGELADVLAGSGGGGSSSRTAVDANGSPLTPGSGAAARNANRIYARDPDTGGTLYDDAGQPVYADEAAKISSLLSARRRGEATSGSSPAAYSSPAPIEIGQISVTTQATDGAQFAREMYDELKVIARSNGDVLDDGSLLVGIR